jgi:hypothetical protein
MIFENGHDYGDESEPRQTRGRTIGNNVARKRQPWNYIFTK